MYMVVVRYAIGPRNTLIPVRACPVIYCLLSNTSEQSSGPSPKRIMLNKLVFYTKIVLAPYLSLSLILSLAFYAARLFL
jgi:hypothetical protein